MIERETTYRVVCDECGYPASDAPTAFGAIEDAAMGGYGVRPFELGAERDLCHDCTPEGKAEARARIIKLCQISWGHDGVHPAITAWVAGAMYDAGTYPEPEAPAHLLADPVSN